MTMASTVKRQISHIRLFSRAIKSTFIEYAGASSIQGFQYLVDPKGNIFTKLIWIAICTVGILSATALVSTFWKRHISNPTRISIESNHAPVGELKFPAMTICHINQISEIRATQLAKTLVLPPDVGEGQFLRYIEQAAGFINKIPYEQKQLNALDDIFAANRLQPVEVMSALVQPCDDFLIKCRWEGMIVPCKTIFKPTFTYYGICCTADLSKSFNYTNSFGSSSGLSVALRPLIEKSTISSVFSNGLRLLVHNSHHYVSQATIEKVLQVKSETIIKIDGTETVCGQSVRELPVARRNCLFQNERKLRFFDAYDDLNCDMDCLFTRILDTCECLPYNYAISPTVNVCNFSQIHCLLENYYNFHEGRDEFPCDCPQDCDATTYTVVANKLSYRRDGFRQANLTLDPFYDDLDNQTIAVHLNNAKQVFRRQRREALTNIIYLAANFGGVYSLFVGVSVITLLEIIYFASVRLARRHNQFCRDQAKFQDDFRVSRSAK